ncbi:MAG: hypothetical protein K2L12_07095 [Clostridia bacterium]|nr:hypothetical protein [Clostridia bacterium]
MDDKYFTIKEYPEDVYCAVGQIIQHSQEWEQEYKRLALMCNIPVKKVTKSSLNKLNDALKKLNYISQEDYKKLKTVIDIRNYINHSFYLIDFQKSYDSYEQRLKTLEYKLNSAQFLIFEATDFIDNIIDKLQGSSIMRPNILDKT